MKFGELLEMVGDEPVFETALLLAGRVDPDDVRRQLSRWVASGRILSLRRGLYTLAAPFRRVTPHPFLLSNHLVGPSFVGLQSALSYHGLIPEGVPVTTAVTTRRPASFKTPLGDFVFRHLGPTRLFGFRNEEVAPGQFAFVAAPEKALLDLVYLTPGGDSLRCLAGLRLEGLIGIDRERLVEFSGRYHSPKAERAARRILRLAEREAGEWEDLP